MLEEKKKQKIENNIISKLKLDLIFESVNRNI